MVITVYYGHLFPIEIWASRDEQQFLRERAATSLHFISKQAIREHAILSPPVFVDRVSGQTFSLSQFLTYDKSILQLPFKRIFTNYILCIIYN